MNLGFATAAVFLINERRDVGDETNEQNQQRKRIQITTTTTMMMMSGPFPSFSLSLSSGEIFLRGPAAIEPNLGLKHDYHTIKNFGPCIWDAFVNNSPILVSHIYFDTCASELYMALRTRIFPRTGVLPVDFCVAETNGARCSNQFLLNLWASSANNSGVTTIYLIPFLAD